MGNMQKNDYRLTEKAQAVSLETLEPLYLRHRKDSSRLDGYKVIKRAMDILLASAVVIFAIPLLIITAVLIKLDSRGPILFKQTRVGLNGRSFTMYKFRTMINGAHHKKHSLLASNEADGPLFKIKDDPRITRLGHYLRKFSIDELPQLFNVLHGDMSVVGPRPALPEEVDKYQAWQLGRLKVIPGITGLWQVSGRSDLPFEEMVKLDIFYARNYSFMLDMKIIAKTGFVVFSGKGAY